MKITHLTSENQYNEHLLNSLNKDNNESHVITLKNKNTKDNPFPYFTNQDSHLLVNNKTISSSDIIHLHNVGYENFNFFSLILLSKIKPLIWSINDMNAFTANCKNSIYCKRYTTGCNQCPNTKLSSIIKKEDSSKLLEYKKYIYSISNLYISTPSKALYRKINASILRDKNIELIPYGICTDAYKPLNKEKIRKKLNLPQNITTLGLHIGNNSYNEKELIDSVRNLSCEFKMNLILFTENNNYKNIYNVPIFNLNNIENSKDLINSFDIMLSTSESEINIPIALQALSQGVPVACSNRSPLSEYIEDGNSGLTYKNLENLLNILVELQSIKNRLEFLGYGARESALKKFNYTLINSMYTKLYENSLLDFSKKVYKLPALNNLPKIALTNSFTESYNIVNSTSINNFFEQPL